MRLTGRTDYFNIQRCNAPAKVCRFHRDRAGDAVSEPDSAPSARKLSAQYPPRVPGVTPQVVRSLRPSVRRIFRARPLTYCSFEIVRPLPDEMKLRPGFPQPPRHVSSIPQASGCVTQNFRLRSFWIWLHCITDQTPELDLVPHQTRMVRDR
jgi:hypothetical protein